MTTAPYQKRRGWISSITLIFEVTKDEVMEGIKSAEEFNHLLFDFIEKLSESKITEYRKTAEKIIGID